MAKPTPKPKPEPANRRRNNTVKVVESLPMQQEESEVPQLVAMQDVTPDVVLGNVELLEKYTLQSLKDYAKASADISASISVDVITSQQVTRLQQLELVGRNCERLMNLLINIKEKQFNNGFFIEFVKPQKSNPVTEKVETAPVAAE